MKKKNIIISAFATIALCMSLIAGSTFALFTSESKVNIAVTSGKVNVVATIDETSVQTKQLNTEYAQGENNMFEASVDFADNCLTLDKLVPGDAIKFNIVVKNESNVTVKYRTIINCENDTGLFAGLKVDINDQENFNGEEYIAKWESMAVGAQDVIVPVTIELPEDANNDYQEKTCTISYMVEAVQGNATTYNKEYRASDADELKDVLTKASAGDLIDATGVEIEFTEQKTTFVGGVTIKGATLDTKSRDGSYLIIDANGEETTFENCTFERGETGANIIAGNAGSGDIVFNNCNFEGPVMPNLVDNPTGTITFNDCTFKITENAMIKSGYVNCMGGTHIFNNCMFDFTGGSTMGSNDYVRWNSVNSYSENYSTDVVLQGCTFINCSTYKYGSNSSLTSK